MLLSIYFLPKYVGIYALLIGFSFVYGLTTILNLRLIRKKCTEKPNFIRFLLCSGLLIIPSSLLGIMLEKMLIHLLGSVLTFLVCSAVVMIFKLLLCFGFGLIDAEIIRKRLKRKTA